LLGWNPGDEREFFTLEELVEAFSLDKVGKSGARFDQEKAKWFNHQYLIKESNESLAELLMPIVVKNGVLVEKEQLSKSIGLVKERATFVSDLWEQLDFFFIRPQQYDAKAVKKRWKTNSYDFMLELKEVLSSIENFSSENTELVVKKWIEEKEYGMGAIMNAFRLLIVGALKGPHLFDIIAMIGKKETFECIDQGLNIIGRKE